MANKIPLAIADVELQLAAAVSVGAETLTLNVATDDDGNALPAGMYCFTIDSGSSNKEYLIGQLNGVNVTSVKSVSRQGVESTGAARAHRVGAPCIVTNFATLQRVADVLRGVVALDGANPIIYDAEPTLSDRKSLATVGYVLDTVTGGSVSFDKQTVGGTGGATIVAGNLVYFNEADQEWYLCDADTASTVEGVMRGIALGAGSDGVGITNGVHLSGVWTTTGLTAGAVYYASNTAGGLATSAGTTKHIVGVALSTTQLWVIPQNRETISTRTKDALAGGGYLGTPSSTNKFVTEDGLVDIQIFTSSGTWTKPAGAVRLEVIAIGAGGGGGGGNRESTGDGGAGGGAGAFVIIDLDASLAGATETVTVSATGGAGGAGSATDNGNNGSDGGNTTFGSLVTAVGGVGGAGSVAGAVVSAATSRNSVFKMVLIPASTTTIGASAAGTAGGTTLASPSGLTALPTGGGTGAGNTSLGSYAGGEAGSISGVITRAGGTGGALGGGTGGDGYSAPTGFPEPGTGGGGGGSKHDSGNGGNGGNGGNYGAGGGGGGSSEVATGGTGGTGGAGILVVRTYFQ